eukprot:2821568-Pyramimonas_sp.AAC.1
MGYLWSWDLETGWGFRESGEEKPAVTMLEPPCRTYSAIFRVSKGSMDSERREALILEAGGSRAPPPRGGLGPHPARGRAHLRSRAHRHGLVRGGPQ